MEHDNETTAVIGAGALGAMYAQQIANAGLPVVFIAEGERAERLRTEGLDVNGAPLRLAVTGFDRDPVSRVIVAVKHDHLASVASELPRIVGADTSVLSVMNGIASEETLAAAIGDIPGSPDCRVLFAMVKGMDAVRSGRAVRFTRIGTVVFGMPKNDPAHPHPRVLDFQRFLDRAGLAWSTPADMLQALWNKFMLNVGINQWSAVLRAPYGVFQRHEPARNLMRAAMREVRMLADARGVPLTDRDIEAWFDVVGTLSPEGRTSMLQDIDAGRKTEVEMFAGRVVALGDELDVPVPVNRALLDAIRTIEAMHR